VAIPFLDSCLKEDNDFAKAINTSKVFEKNFHTIETTIIAPC
jgi:hypothetical protein